MLYYTLEVLTHKTRKITPPLMKHLQLQQLAVIPLLYLIQQVMEFVADLIQVLTYLQPTTEP